MTQNDKQVAPAKQYGLGALITTGVAATLISIAGSMLAVHYTVLNRPIEHPIALVDVVRMASEMARVGSKGADIEQIVTQYAANLNSLKDAGYIDCPDETPKLQNEILARCFCFHNICKYSYKT